MKIALESLGCSKNLVDAEIMLGLLNKNSHQLVSSPEDADIVIVNTCGFIESAKQESIDAIIEIAELKNQGIIKFLIVSGCLAQRYTEELMEEIPEIDSIVGTGSYQNIVEIVDELMKNHGIVDKGDIDFVFNEELPRYISTPPYMSYLKIGEGCDNNCTYCIIPKLRGKYRSRKIEDLVREAQDLYSKGVQELVVIAQDTTVYGIDLYNEPRLHELLLKLSDIGFKWIRVMYSYPEGITEEIVQAIASRDNICSYFDIPMQHASDRILKLMNRRTNRKELTEKVNMIRRMIPDATIRTTFIVGFPGETEEDFEGLLDFVDEVKLDRMGAFTYSREEDTPADKLPNHLDEDIKKERLERLMLLQQGISESLNRQKIGNTYEVLVEDKIDDRLYIGRTQYDANEIDSLVYIETVKSLEIGSFLEVEITSSYEYDLKGKVKSEKKISL